MIRRRNLPWIIVRKEATIIEGLAGGKSLFDLLQKFEVEAFIIFCLQPSELLGEDDQNFVPERLGNIYSSYFSLLIELGVYSPLKTCFKGLNKYYLYFRRDRQQP